MKTKRVLESNSFKLPCELTNFVKENNIKQEDIQSINVTDGIWKYIIFYWKEEVCF